ncbi:hypothetical protein [Actinacidiphila oryziradicis]|nr:hypothetical protein [Actinacidiphila oryziradicis]
MLRAAAAADLVVLPRDSLPLDERVWAVLLRFGPFATTTGSVQHGTG